MDVSIVIPTLDREEELKDALDSILRQTKLPKEIIIVDDSDNYKTRDLIEQMHRNFLNKGITLKYLRKKEEKNLAMSKNIGVTQATGEISLFLDDDVILDKEYVREILKIYERNPNAIGVQGYIISESIHTCSSRLVNLVHKIFFLFFKEKDKCRVLPSGRSTYPIHLPTRIIKCQWLSGIASYKKNIFKEFEFDENLKEYSLGEDKDFSYRIYKRYPNSLYMTPHAKLIHKSSPSKLNSRCKIYIETIYPAYLFFKNIKQTPRNRIIFLWSNFGRLVVNMRIMLTKKKPRSIAYLIGSYIYILNHLNEIKNGSFNFFNDNLEHKIR